MTGIGFFDKIPEIRVLQKNPGKGPEKLGKGNAATLPRVRPTLTIRYADRGLRPAKNTAPGFDNRKSSAQVANLGLRRMGAGVNPLL
jgi:hypothetical protein